MVVAGWQLGHGSVGQSVLLHLLPYLDMYMHGLHLDHGA